MLQNQMLLYEYGTSQLTALPFFLLCNLKQQILSIKQY